MGEYRRERFNPFCDPIKSPSIPQRPFLFARHWFAVKPTVPLLSQSIVVVKQSTTNFDCWEDLTKTQKMPLQFVYQYNSATRINLNLYAQYQWDDYAEYMRYIGCEPQPNVNIKKLIDEIF